MNKAHTEQVRLFVAVPLPEAIKDHLTRWAQQNKTKLPFRKWTHPADYHITLQFLGETSMDKLERLKTALSDVQLPTFGLRLNTVGTFGPPKAPRILWTSVDGDLPSLGSLHKDVVRRTSPLGFVPEDRPYKPHITLARTFAGEGGLDAAPFSGFRSSEQWTVDHFVLMRTHLRASPMYETIGKYPLSNR
ncbi:RNA 2',3'-cyclic phosphodiesterase [Paenibacillus harenae]|uniref:RNA 2',3'-cyclic phosphodiesterase n=1 Tax=Paenibacillus harenae TaxID=306543 RepID=A0ABT9U027_PAEHA|nr:RNA 2',3'-cyclic phosphodiesterase [Paenibacillus harenae]MDQ0112617.1 2'-5' RNA ligase [Paenibacillus harenae]